MQRPSWRNVDPFLVLLAIVLVAYGLTVISSATHAEGVAYSGTLARQAVIASFGVVLMAQDAALWLWGPNDIPLPRPRWMRGFVEIAGQRFPLFDLVLKHVHPPVVEEGPFRLLGTILEANPYLGRIITGRIASGKVKPNQSIKVLSRDGKLVENGRISKILAFRGLERTAIDEAEAGDIVAIAGLPKGTVADTFCDPTVETPLQAQPIDPPTVSMSFIVNNSPLAGTEGDKVTSRLIRDRLMREAEGNVALRVVESAEKDAMEVSGRGELQLAILIETMRREGFELSVSRPRVVLEKDENGQMLEPVEEVVIDVDEEFSGVVVQKMSERKAEFRIRARAAR